MKKIINLSVALCIMIFITACGKKETTTTNNTPSAEKPKSMMNAETEQEKMIKDGRGIGEVKMVSLSVPLEQERVKRGKDIYDMKCSSCHKLTAERIVGPGWEGVTTRRKPEWIMNMTTNADVMLERDPEAQKMLELCLTRMPNQNVSIGDARDVLEYMRSNDGVK